MNEMSKAKSKALFVRVPPLFYEAIAKIGEEECRTQQSIVNHAIKEYLERRGLLPQKGKK